jgi:hypothetical protein
MILLRIHVKLELATHTAGNISRRYLKKTKATPHYTEFSQCTLHGLTECDVPKVLRCANQSPLQHFELGRSRSHLKNAT